jgi:hypothetical protein
VNIPLEFDLANEEYRRRLVGEMLDVWEEHTGARIIFPGINDQPEPDPKTAALIDIAHDCGTLEAAQRRAKQALKQ